MKSALRILLLAALAAGCGPDAPQEPAAAPPSVEKPTIDCGAWQPLDAGTKASFRGLSAASDDVVWVSGTGGTWGRTVDAGATWVMGAVPEAEELDFRDVDAFDENIAYLMSAGPGEASRVYKTIDGGATWQLQKTNSSPEGFWDGMAFWDPDRGLLYGDPVDGRLVVMATEDGGATWNRVPAEGMPPALEGEAGFAASGSGLAVAEGGHAWFGTGGPAARVFRSTDYGLSWSVVETPMRAGEGSQGIFSLAFADARRGFAVGGDYTQPEATPGNAARTSDGGLTWQPVAGSPPAGYRSAVAYAPGNDGQVLIAAGTSGSDLSLDGGETWTPLKAASGEPLNLNAVAFGDSPCAAWAAGPEGRLARLTAEMNKGQGP